MRSARSSRHAFAVPAQSHSWSLAHTHMRAHAHARTRAHTSACCDTHKHTPALKQTRVQRYLRTVSRVAIPKIHGASIVVVDKAGIPLGQLRTHLLHQIPQCPTTHRKMRMAVQHHGLVAPG